jgi:hypothetical protein
MRFFKGTKIPEILLIIIGIEIVIWSFALKIYEPGNRWKSQLILGAGILAVGIFNYTTTKREGVEPGMLFIGTVIYLYFAFAPIYWLLGYFGIIGS